MSFPFLLLAISVASGILVSSLFFLPSSASMPGLVAFLFAAWLAYFLRKTRLSLACALAAVFFLGAGLYFRAEQDYRHNSLAQLDLDGYADFTGRLYRSPSYGIDRTYLYLKTESIRYLGREQKAVGNLRVAVLHASKYPSPIHVNAGDKIKVNPGSRTSIGARTFIGRLSPKAHSSWNSSNGARRCRCRA
jgi:hypothetical protein